VVPSIVTVPLIQTTALPTTTLETTAVIFEQNKSNDSLRDELIFRQNLISQKLKHDLESRKNESE